MCNISAARYLLYTPLEYQYKKAWLTTHKTAFTFKLRSCIEARLLISKHPGDDMTEAAELFIGTDSNSRTKFLPNRQAPGTNEVSEETPNILSCDTFRDFWMSWDGKYFEFGKGTIIKENKVLEKGYSNTLTVNAIAFSSISAAVPPGQSYGGEWDFAQAEGALQN